MRTWPMCRAIRGSGETDPVETQIKYEAHPMREPMSSARQWVPWLLLPFELAAVAFGPTFGQTFTKAWVMIALAHVAFGPKEQP